jgi:hypothetical protein
MEKLWVVIARDGVVPVYLKTAKKKSTAKKYLEECEEFFGENCEMKMGEFYTLDEAEQQLGSF